MVEIGIVITLLVSVVLALSGAFMHILAASFRHPLKAAQSQLAEHAARISDLERYRAKIEQMLEHISRGQDEAKETARSGIEELKVMFREHEKHTRRGDRE